VNIGWGSLVIGLLAGWLLSGVLSRMLGKATA
jgi:hypothetical protein